MTVVTLYGKPGCCLCDDARAALEQVRRARPFELREVDVTLDPALHSEYGERIPVVEVPGADPLELRVGVPELHRLLDTVGT